VGGGGGPPILNKCFAKNAWKKKTQCGYQRATDSGGKNVACPEGENRAIRSLLAQAGIGGNVHGQRKGIPWETSGLKRGERCHERSKKWNH